MIGWLKGKIVLISDESILLDVGGVGYRVFAPLNLINNFTLNEEAEFFIETLVREDSINLYGFKNLDDKKLFNLLKTVQGVGSKLALTIMGTISISDLQEAIMLNNPKAIQIIPGVGAKVSLRIVSELKDKIEKIFTYDTLNTKKLSNTKGNNLDSTVVKEAEEALKGLGYSGIESFKAVNYAVKNLEKNADVSAIIKKALNYFLEKTTNK